MIFTEIYSLCFDLSQTCYMNKSILEMEKRKVIIRKIFLSLDYKKRRLEHLQDSYSNPSESFHKSKREIVFNLMIRVSTSLTSRCHHHTTTPCLVQSMIWSLPQYLQGSRTVNSQINPLLSYCSNCLNQKQCTMQLQVSFSL